MIIFGDTISFKSKLSFYYPEEGGRKPNTVRLITLDEYEKIREWHNNRPGQKIEITRADGKGQFTRYISDISFIGELAGYYIMVISWIHPSAKCSGSCGGCSK